MGRLRANLAVLLAAMVVIASSAAVLVGRPPVEVEVHVVGGLDSSRMGRVDTLVLEVRNSGDRELRPVFFVMDGSPGSYKAWRVVEGPEALAPHSSARYVIKAPYPLNAIPSGRTFIVIVLDLNDESFEARSRLCRLHLPFTSIRNPSLSHWVYDVKSACRTPYAWSFVSCREGGEVAVVEEANGSARLAVANMSRRRGDWLMAGLWQTVEAPGVLRVRVKPMFSTPVTHRPPRVVAVEVGYGQWTWTGHRRISNYTVIPYRGLWIAFTDEVDEPVLLNGCLWGNIAIYFVPVEVGEWNVVEVNVTELLHRLGWEEPEPTPYPHGDELYVVRRAELTLFVAEYPWNRGVGEPLEAYFDLVDLRPHRG